MAFVAATLLVLAPSSSPPTPPALASVLQSMAHATDAALRHQWTSTGQAKCDYHLLQGEWYDYEQLWHTGQLAAGLLAAQRTLQLTNPAAVTDATLAAGKWWVSQAVTGPSSSPTLGLIQSIDRREGGFGCITDACGPTEDLTDVSDGSRAMFLLTNWTGDGTYADAATASARWQLRHMKVSVPGDGGINTTKGLYYNVVNMTTGRPITATPTTLVALTPPPSLDKISRSNIEGSLFLDTCRHTGDQELCAAFLEQANASVLRQDHRSGLWMQWTPNDPSTGRFHPRFNTW